MYVPSSCPPGPPSVTEEPLPENEERLEKINVGNALAVKVLAGPLILASETSPPKVPAMFPPVPLVNRTLLRVPRAVLNPAKEMGTVEVLTVVPEVLKEAGPTVWVWIIA